jgi:hypothetical protein
MFYGYRAGDTTNVFVTFEERITYYDTPSEITEVAQVGIYHQIHLR